MAYEETFGWTGELEGTKSTLTFHFHFLVLEGKLRARGGGSLRFLDSRNVAEKYADPPTQSWRRHLRQRQAARRPQNPKASAKHFATRFEENGSECQEVKNGAELMLDYIMQLRRTNSYSPFLLVANSYTR